MNLPSASTHTTGNREPQSDVDTRLFGRWLILARVLWSAVVVFTLLILVAILPVYGAQLQTVCADVACAFGQLTPEQAERLQDLGLSLGGYTALNVALTIVEALVWFAVGAVLVWRKSHDWMALLVV